MGLSCSLLVKIRLKTDVTRTDELKAESSVLEQEAWGTNEWEEDSIKTLKRGWLNLEQASWGTWEGHWMMIAIKRKDFKERNYWHYKS